MPKKTTISAYVEQLQSKGKYTFTRDLAESETGGSFVSVQSALGRLKKQGRIISPRRGFYVVVPPEYRATGSPPASWFIDALMEDFGQPYYVALLSAAALHGAAHQQPMVFQVMTSKPTRRIQAAKVSVRFLMRGKLERMPVTEVQTETGTMRVATPETTAFDLVRYPAAAGHWGNVTLVLAELAERMDSASLLQVAEQVGLPDVQRLGYLLEMLGEGDLVDSMADWLGSRRPRVVPLGAGKTGKTKINKRWRIMPNVELDVEG